MAALARWLEVARLYNHQLDQLMATRYRESLVSDRLYNSVAATEGFHKLAIGPRQGRSLGKRLLECVDLAGDNFAELVADVPAWVAAIVAARNRIGHGDQAGAFEAGRTYHLAQSVYWLFVLCLLRQAKVHPTVLARTVTSSEWT